jgi:surfactin synthase thioesterase subunit
MRVLEEDTVPIQVPQAEKRMRKLTMTQLHPMVVTMTQMMIQS